MVSPYPLPAWERRLRRRVQSLLPDDEQVLAAIAVLQGPQPGAEGCLALTIGPLASLLTLIGIGWLIAARSRFTIALTDRGLVLVKPRRLLRRGTLLARTERLAALGPFNETEGAPYVEFLGERYWMYGFSSFEAYTMRKLIAAKMAQSGTDSHRPNRP